MKKFFAGVFSCFCVFCAFCFSACSLDATYSDTVLCPYVLNDSLYAFPLFTDSQNDGETISLQKNGWSFMKDGVESSRKRGCVLAWNSNSQKLMHIHSSKKVLSSVKLPASKVYTGQNFVLSQTSTFTQDKGFAFSLYKIEYSSANKKIKLKTVWNGYADCFVSDYFFTQNGVCIAGGTQNNKTLNVFYINGQGIHNCFTTAKHSDFLRLVYSGNSEKVYAFVSTQDKSDRSPVIYSFNMTQAPEQAVTIDLSGDSLLPAGFDCFFGYSFPESVEGPSVRIILPASINGTIQFICYDSTAGKISGVVPDAVGCATPLASSSEGTYYIARDPLIQDSWYGIALFTGTECKKITKFF